MTDALTALAALLPVRAQPYAKALVPAIGTILAVAVQYAITGELDRAELATAITGGLTTLTTFLTPNA